MGPLERICKCRLLHAWLICFFIPLLTAQQSANAQMVLHENTFQRLLYPGAKIDSSRALLLHDQYKDHFPEAKSIFTASCLTADNLHNVLFHYMNLNLPRFLRTVSGYRSIIDENAFKPRSRVEITSIELPFVRPDYWPTQIDIVLVCLPIAKDSTYLNRTALTLKEKIGSVLVYAGEMREDIAEDEMERIGSDGEIFVIATRDRFTQVVEFFTERLGKIWVIPSVNGGVLLHDFEVDATKQAGFDSEERELYIRAEENPIVFDNAGNSTRLMGMTFIRYLIWDNSKKKNR